MTVTESDDEIARAISHSKDARGTMAAMNAIPYAPWLFILRLYMGLFWLDHGLRKVTDRNWAGPNGDCAGFVSQTIAHTGGWFHDFVTGTVLPNINVFAYLVAWGETLVGVSLLLGLLTAVGAIGGMFLAANYMLLKGGPTVNDGWASYEGATIALCFMCLVLPVGRAWGLDTLVFRRSARGALRAPPR
jgi:uncharacterized membrane protein YphA (DoxX/SURF4 family)